MTDEKMVYMANQIAKFFHSKSEGEGVAGIADHISKFWDPRMRAQLFDYVNAGGQALDPWVVAAVPSIRPVSAA